jgi:hypothetical protein
MLRRQEIGPLVGNLPRTPGWGGIQVTIHFERLRTSKESLIHTGYEKILFTEASRCSRQPGIWILGSKQSTWRCTVGQPRFIRASSSRDTTPPSIRSTWHISTQTASRRSRSSKCGPPRPAQGRVATAPSKRSLPDNDTSASSRSDKYSVRPAQAQGKRSGAWAETRHSAGCQRRAPALWRRLGEGE